MQNMGERWLGNKSTECSSIGVEEYGTKNGPLSNSTGKGHDGGDM